MTDQLQAPLADLLLDAETILDRLGVPRTSPTRVWTLAERIKWLGRQADRSQPPKPIKPADPRPTMIISEHTTLAEFAELRRQYTITRVEICPFSRADETSAHLVHSTDTYSGVGATLAQALNQAMVRLRRAVRSAT